MKRGYLIYLILTLLLVSSIYSVEDSLVAYYNLDETKYDVIEDSSGNGNHGVPDFYIKNNPTSSMLSQFGLYSAFIPEGITDSHTGTYGWHTDSATEGAYLAIDLGEGNTKKYRKARVFASGSYPGVYNVQYSDDNVNWVNAAMGFNPNGAGWQEKVWDYVGSHRYWRLYLTNTPGPGAWLTELELYEESATSVEGKIGKAISFDGVGNRINVANPNNAVLNPITGTVEIWIRPNKMESNYIFSHSTDRFSIYLSSSTDMSFYYNNVNIINLNPNFVDNSGIWHHVAVTYNGGGECKMYIDGTQLGNGICATTFPVSSADAIIGWGYATNYGFNGAIDEVKIYIW